MVVGRHGWLHTSSSVPIFIQLNFLALTFTRKVTRISSHQNKSNYTVGYIILTNEVKSMRPSLLQCLILPCKWEAAYLPTKPNQSGVFIYGLESKQCLPNKHSWSWSQYSRISRSIYTSGIRQSRIGQFESICSWQSLTLWHDSDCVIISRI